MWCVVFAVLAYPVDGWILGYFRRHRLGGDIRRELEAAQQYGQFVSSLLIALVIWLQDPAGRRRLADWGVAFLVAGVVCNGAKWLVGRPRPMFEDPHTFLGPLGKYPISSEVGVHHAWEFWGKNAADLWSMPSSHTAYACLMAVFVGSRYPRLRVLVGALAVLVGLARIVVGAHYPSDVAVGAGIGLCLGRTAVSRRWGEWALGRIGRGGEGKLAQTARRDEISGRSGLGVSKDAGPVGAPTAAGLGGQSSAGSPG